MPIDPFVLRSIIFFFPSSAAAPPPQQQGPAATRSGRLAHVPGHWLGLGQAVYYCPGSTSKTTERWCGASCLFLETRNWILHLSQPGFNGAIRVMAWSLLGDAEERPHLNLKIPLKGGSDKIYLLVLSV